MRKRITKRDVAPYLRGQEEKDSLDLALLIREELITAKAVASLMVLINRAKPQILNYREYLRSPEWDRVRDRKLTESGHQCTLCPSRKTLQVHHRTYERVGKERMEDLVVLCRKCHARHHDAVV